MRTLISRLVAIAIAATLLSTAAVAAEERTTETGTEAETRIVGGVVTSISTRPFQVALFPPGSLCGASIVHPSYVITAAHCVDSLLVSDTVSLRVGSSLYASGGTYVTGVPRTNVSVHASWNPSTSDNDIAVIRLNTPLALTANIQPVRVVEPGMGTLWQGGDAAIVSGWGSTASGGSISPQLRKVTVPIVSDAQCLASGNDGFFHPSTMLCAGPLAGGKDSCQGDSGGPLTVVGPGGPFLVGVVSWGFGCALPNYPGVYTRVGSYNTWIRARVPISDDFADAELMSGAGPHITTSIGATRETGEPVVPGSATAKTVWYRCLATTTGTFNVDTAGTGYDTVLGVYTGSSFGTFQVVGTNDDFNGAGESRVTFAAEKGTVYKIQVGSFSSAQGAPRLNRTLPCALESFSDVGRYSTFFEDIEWLAGNDIASGYSDGTFKPGNSASRQAVASYFYRYSGSPAGPFPDPGFSDVPPTHPFFTEIAWAAANGIVGGYTDGTFKPTNPVSRQALVALLYRLAGSPLGPFPDPGYTDVSSTHGFYTEIAWAASVGVVSGYEDGSFQPTRSVNRQEFSAILHRYDNLP